MLVLFEVYSFMCCCCFIFHFVQMALVIAKELELLSIAAQHQTIYPSIQQDTELLVCAINLLRSINDIGKSGGNVFSREEKATGVDSIDPHHPVYGLKKDLIRLIANMAYKHRANQDLVNSTIAET
uniref:Uncharacterized protein n=1 Tax=Biomphalaria glabrata TaxID=6526 RepID=A0A2C9LT24_BIOGL